MIYQLEYLDKYPHHLWIHVDKNLTRTGNLIFRSESDHKERQPNFVKYLWAVNGVSLIEVHSYCIVVGKGTVFEWKDMVSSIIFVLSLTLDKEDTMIEKAPPLGLSNPQELSVQKEEEETKK